MAPQGGRSAAESAEIRAALRDQIEAVIRALYPDAKIQGPEMRFHLANGDVCGMVIRGHKVGAFLNFSTGEPGGPLEPIIAARGSVAEAFVWARAWLGWDKNAVPTQTAEERAADDRARSEAAEKRAADDAMKRAGDIARATGTFLHAAPKMPGTPAALYLAGRGLLLGDTPGRGVRVPCLARCLRFHRSLYHPHMRQHYPAMVAAIMDPATREMVAVHCTYLAIDKPRDTYATTIADVRWTKAAIATPRLVFGPKRGCIIPLQKGKSGKSWARAPEGDRLLICEGIEDGLTLAWLYPDHRVWAAIDIGNLAAIDIPQVFQNITWARDNDGFKPGPEHARDLAWRRWRSEGRHVTLVPPLPGYKDHNDYLQAQLAHTVPPVWIDEDMQRKGKPHE